MREHLHRGDVAVGGEQRKDPPSRHGARGCRFPSARAIRSKRSVQSRAASASRQTGWLADTLDAFALARIETELVFGMESRAAADVPQDRGNTLVVLDEKRAGG